MTNNVYDLTGQPYEPPAIAAPEPLTVRIRVDMPDAPSAPALTPLGALVAVVVSVGTFVLVGAALGG